MTIWWAFANPHWIDVSPLLKSPNQSLKLHAKGKITWPGISLTGVLQGERVDLLHCAVWSDTSKLCSHLCKDWRSAQTYLGRVQKATRLSVQQALKDMLHSYRLSFDQMYRTFLPFHPRWEIKPSDRYVSSAKYLTSLRGRGYWEMVSDFILHAWTWLCHTRVTSAPHTNTQTSVKNKSLQNRRKRQDRETPYRHSSPINTHGFVDNELVKRIW